MSVIMHPHREVSCYCYAFNPMNIVFIHFGSKLPKHLQRNLERTAELFDEHRIFLISDNSHFDLPISVTNFIVSLDEDSEAVKKQLSHPQWFRKNFWFSTLRRFLVFSDFMRIHPEPLLHIESDVVISQDFPFAIFESFEKTFAFPLISHTQGIPSVLFIKNLAGAEELRQCSIREASLDPTTTDMLILRKLLAEHVENVLVLPSGPDLPDCYRANSQSDYKSIQEVGLRRVKGIIDGAAIGQFIGGDDPRNHRGVRRVFEDSKYSSLLPSKLKLTYSSERKFVNLQLVHSSIPIFSLHVHSKDLRFFEEKKLPKILVKRLSNLPRSTKKEFLPQVFLVQLAGAIKRRLKKPFAQVLK
jgi:hypothetical protein